MLSDGLGARVEANKLFACPAMQYGLWNVEAGQIDDARLGTAPLTASGAGSLVTQGRDMLPTSSMIWRGSSVMILGGATRPTLAQLRLMLSSELARKVGRQACVLAQMVDARALPRRWLGINRLGASIQLVLEWSVRGGGESLRGGATSRTSKKVLVSFSALLVQTSL